MVPERSAFELRIAEAQITDLKWQDSTLPACSGIAGGDETPPCKEDKACWGVGRSWQIRVASILSKNQSCDSCLNV